MSLSVLATGLLITFAAVLWMALVLWGLVCPSDGFDTEDLPERKRTPERPPRAVPNYRALDLPILFTSEPPGPSLPLPPADNVVSLDQWREKSKRAG